MLDNIEDRLTNISTRSNIYASGSSNSCSMMFDDVFYDDVFSCLARNVIKIGPRDHIKSALELTRRLCYIFYFKFQYQYQYFVLPDSVFKQSLSLFPYETLQISGS